MNRPDDLVARVGGEEFVILLPETDTEGALRIAGKLHEAVSSLSVPSAGIGAGAVTVSVGLAVGPADAASPNDLYRRADEALYAAKEGGATRPDAHPVIRKIQARSSSYVRSVPDPVTRGASRQGPVQSIMYHEAPS